MNYSPEIIKKTVDELQRRFPAFTFSFDGTTWKAVNRITGAPAPLPLPAADIFAIVSKYNKQDVGSAAGSEWWQKLSNSPAVVPVANAVANVMSTPAMASVSSSFSSYTGSGAVATTRANIREAGDSGGHAAAQLVEGAGNAVSGAVGAGLKIGQALLEGALSPFGKSGEAVARFSGQVGDMLQTGLKGGFSLLSNLASAGGKVLGTAVGAVGAVAGAGVGAVAGAGLGAVLGGGIGAAPGLFMGAALGSMVGAALMKITEAITGAISSALSAVGQAFGAFGELATNAFKMISDVLSDVTSSAEKYAHQILAISQQSGASTESTQKAVNVAQSLGVNPDEVEALKRPREQQMMTQKAWGIQGEAGSAEAVDSFSTKYNELAAKGGMGLVQAQKMAKDTGYEKYIPAANMSPEMRAQQVSRSDKMESALGIDGNQIAAAGQQFTMLKASIAQFADMIKTKFGAELIPYINSMLDMAISWVSDHADQISAGIQAGVQWLVNDLPVMLLSGASMVLGVLVQVMTFLANNAQGILAFVDAVINGFRGIMFFILKHMPGKFGVKDHDEFEQRFGKDSHMADDDSGLKKFATDSAKYFTDSKANIDKMTKDAKDHPLLAPIQTIAHHTGETAKNTKPKSATDGAGGQANVLALMNSYLIADTVRSNARP